MISLQSLETACSGFVFFPNERLLPANSVCQAFRQSQLIRPTRLCEQQAERFTQKERLTKHRVPLPPFDVLREVDSWEAPGESRPNRTVPGGCMIDSWRWRPRVMKKNSDAEAKDGLPSRFYDCRTLKSQSPPFSIVFRAQMRSGVTAMPSTNS